MQLATVIGSVWSTRKDERLIGMKLMVVKPINNLGEDSSRDSFVAVDSIGAGIGETVLVVNGNSARVAANNDNAPVDAAIVGIIDDKETGKQ